MPNQDVHRVLPDHFSIKNLEISTHITDRCSINVAMMNWAQSRSGILWHVVYGVHHDLWNTVKPAIRKTKDHAGQNTSPIWGSVVNFSAIANLPHGTF